MKFFKKMFYILLIIIGLIIVSVVIIFHLPQFGKNPTGERLARIEKSPHYQNGEFQNLDPVPNHTSFSKFFEILYKNFFVEHKDKTPLKKIPAVKTDLKNLKDNSLVWLGHSSYFLKIEGKNILIDPVFNPASPFSLMVKPFPAEYEYSHADLPDIDLLIITHDHYDHLDYELMKTLKPKIKKILTSLGVGSHFEHWGFDNQIITELDWYENTTFETMKFTAVPTRHFSGRSLVRNKTLWACFMLEMNDLTLLIGSDSGYGSQISDIAKKFPKIDLALLENGQYNEDWRNIHFLPADLLKTIRELNPQRVFSGHHSKFSLARHPWYEPLEGIWEASQKEKFNLATPKIGEILDLKNPEQKFEKWWRDLK